MTKLAIIESAVALNRNGYKQQKSTVTTAASLSFIFIVFRTRFLFI